MKNNQKAPENYSAGKKELESIQQKLENDDFDIDQLEDLIDRGKYLIEYLSAKLRKIEDKIDTSDKK